VVNNETVGISEHERELVAFMLEAKGWLKSIRTKKRDFRVRMSELYRKKGINKKYNADTFCSVYDKLQKAGLL
jgi:hypothetical protein